MRDSTGNSSDQAPVTASVAAPPNSTARTRPNQPAVTPDIDLLELGVPANARVPAHPDPGGDSGYGSTRKRSGRSYLWAAFASVATALAAAPLLAFIDLTNKIGRAS